MYMLRYFRIKKVRNVVWTEQAKKGTRAAQFITTTITSADFEHRCELCCTTVDKEVVQHYYILGENFEASANVVGSLILSMHQ